MKITEWVRMLPMELDMVKPTRFANNDEAEPKEKILLTEVSDDLKKMWCYSKQLAKEAATLALEGSFGKDNGEEVNKEQTLARCYELKKKADIVKDIFWLCCNEEANSWGIGGIGIRKNWELVQLVRDERDLPPNIKRLLGLDDD